MAATAKWLTPYEMMDLLRIKQSPNNYRTLWKRLEELNIVPVGFGNRRLVKETDLERAMQKKSA